MTYPFPKLDDLATAIRDGREGLAIGGITPGARGLVLASLARSGWPSGRVLVVVPHVADAADLAAGLEILSPELKVGVIPAEGAAPYRGTEPPLAARLELVRLLARFEAGDVQLLVAPARVLLAPIPDPATAKDRTLQIELGSRLETHDLGRWLAEAGYRRVDLVEEAGEFAVRGWVVDLHSGDGFGLRVEMDDDVVERIQRFDPSTQRSVGDGLDRLELTALDPFPGGEEWRDAVADQLEGEYPACAGLMREGAERRLWWGSLHLAGGPRAGRRSWIPSWCVIAMTLSVS